MKRSYLGLFFCMYQLTANALVEDQVGFVSLPNDKASSAYMTCDTTSNFGLNEKSDVHNAPGPCSISNAKLIESPMNAPITKFTLVGIISRGVPIPEPYASSGSEEFATLTDTIWHNEATKECIFGTHILMKDQILSNGKRWEINDIVRGGFAGRPVAVAYFVRPSPSHDYGMPETLFRAGRTYTSVPYENAATKLPNSKPQSITKAISRTQDASFNDNWVDFTTDISFDDTDGVTRKMTSMLYIKTTCEQRQPEEKDGAIRLRTTSGDEKDWLEIDVPGLVPAGASVN